MGFVGAGVYVRFFGRDSRDGDGGVGRWIYVKVGDDRTVFELYECLLGQRYMERGVGTCNGLYSREIGRRKYRIRMSQRCIQMSFFSKWVLSLQGAQGFQPNARSLKNRNTNMIYL